MAEHFDKAGAYGPVLGKTVAAGSPYSPAIKRFSAMAPEQYVKDALRRILSIGDSHDRLIRNWMTDDAPVFRGSHSGVGAVTSPCAPVSAWRAAYPQTPLPTKVQPD